MQHANYRLLQGISSSPPLDDHIEYVYLQTWTPIHNRRYWIVEHNGITIRPAGGQPAQDHIESVQKREVERSRKSADSNTRMLCFARQSPWLERTGWERMLQGRNLAVLSAMIEVPRRQDGQPHILGRDPNYPEDNVVDSNIAAGTQSDSVCFPALHTTDTQCCVDEVLELLFRLSVALFKEQPINERPDSMLAVLFSSILGYSKTRQSFLQARDFTTHLSALIYNQQLILLKRALPVRAYLNLSIKYQPQRNQLQQLNKVRKQFLVARSASSFNEFFNLRNYSRMAAQSDSPPFLLH
ncbi:telomere-associated helicase [Trichoderma cornu-damae]|uniref:Telomere-associated helicase n=1 Tax=Trichoderma cornu-damae TaxID=654480 RepID=A0A9P8QEN0_9HYPO|nr:telomere-associated helicase [Trichoderma cornu-damae]